MNLSPLRLSALAAAASLLVLSPSGVRAAEPDCASLVGTFLTKNSAEAGSYTSRSLISFTDGGLAFFTDSGEGGAEGFAPFTDGRGAWRCVWGEGNAPKVKATTLDFTAATATDPNGGFGRLDFELSYDPKAKTISGTATLYFIPLGDDPLAPGELKDGREFAIAGQRVEARE